MFEMTLWNGVPPWWLVHPDHVTRQVEAWEKELGKYLAARRARQYTDDIVFALTITDPDVPDDRKHLALFLNVHAPEYGATAGIMDFAAAMLTGRDLQGREATFDAAELRRRLVVTLVPDSNPQGRRRLPYALTDGSVFDNRDGDTIYRMDYGIRDGKPFVRRPSWRMSEEHAEAVGGIYEKISADEYVIPDMDERSTVLKLVDALGYQYRYEMAGHIHQAEFVGREENCYCATSIEPWISPPMQELQDEWACFVLDHWRKIGGRPIADIDHHRWGPSAWVTDPVTGHVRKMGIDFTTLRFGCPSLVMETQMNDPRTDPAEQMRLAAEGIEASLRFLLQGDRAPSTERRTFNVER